MLAQVFRSFVVSPPAGFNRPQHQIDALSDDGRAAGLRHQLTDFGSGWLDFLKKQSSLQHLLLPPPPALAIPEERRAFNRPVFDRLEQMKLREFMEMNPKLSRREAVEVVLEAKYMGKATGSPLPNAIQAKIEAQTARELATVRAPSPVYQSFLFTTTEQTQKLNTQLGKQVMRSGSGFGTSLANRSKSLLGRAARFMSKSL